MEPINAKWEKEKYVIEKVISRANNWILKRYLIQISANLVVSIILFSIGGICYGWVIDRDDIFALWIFILFISLAIIFTVYESTDLQDKDPLYSKNSEFSPHSQTKQNLLNTSQEIKTLLRDSVSSQITLETLQEHYHDLLEMERYFSVLGEGNWKNESVQNVLRKSVAKTPSELLKQCSNPLLFQNLLELSMATDAPLTSDSIKLLDALVRAAHYGIDNALKGPLDKNDKEMTLGILNALHDSNRSTEDLLKFFEIVRWPKEDMEFSIDKIKKIVSALQKNTRRLSKYHQDVRSLLTSVANSRTLDGPLLNKINDQTFRKNLLEIGSQISSVNMDTAKWFVYEELSKLSDASLLKEEFFPFMQRVVPILEGKLRRIKYLLGIKYLRRIIYPNIPDKFWSVLDHDWNHPDPENIGDLPNEIKAPYRAASKKKPADTLSQESDDNQDEKSNEQQNRNQDETQDSNPNQDTPPSE
jgi:hypothetical protein